MSIRESNENWQNLEALEQRLRAERQDSQHAAYQTQCCRSARASKGGSAFERRHSAAREAAGVYFPLGGNWTE